MWNPFKKKKQTTSNGTSFSPADSPKDSGGEKMSLKDKAKSASMNPDTKKETMAGSNLKNKFFGAGASMMANIAMKKVAKMSPQERQKMMVEVMNPKNKDKMLEVMEHMRSAGQISEEQYRMAKEKLGL